MLTGMFPYCMLATLPVFCYADWPRTLLAKFPVSIQKRLLPTEIERNEHCIYPTDPVKKGDGDTGAVQDIIIAKVI